MKRVLAIPGSLRRESFNRRLLVAAQQLKPPGLSIEICESVGLLPLLNQDLEPPAGTLPAVVTEFAAAVKGADGVLIATPEYNQSIPGVLKNAIDWLSRESLGEVLLDKPIAVMGATPGPWGTRLSQAALRQALLATEALVMPKPGVWVREARGVFDASGKLTDERTTKNIARLLVAFERWIDTVGSK